MIRINGTVATIWKALENSILRELVLFPSIGTWLFVFASRLPAKVRKRYNNNIHLSTCGYSALVGKSSRGQVVFLTERTHPSSQAITYPTINRSSTRLQAQ